MGRKLIDQKVSFEIDADTGAVVDLVTAEGASVNMARFSGRGRLVSPSGAEVALRAKPLPLVVSFGDSIFVYDSNTEAITSLTYDAATGLATANFSGAINVKKGDIVGIDAVDESYREYEVQYTEVLSYTTTPSVSLTYRPTNPPTGDASGGGLLLTRWGSSNRSVMAFVNFLTGRRLRHISAGAGGDTGTRMLARFDTDVAAHNPDYVLVSFGTNDIYGSDRAVSAMLADLTEIHRRVTAIGAQMMFLTNPPQPSARAGWTAAKLAKHFDWRNRARSYCVANGVPFFDWHSSDVNGASVINATDANGNPVADIVQADNIHPTRKGVFGPAKRIAEWFNASVPRIDRLVASSADATNLINGLFTGSGAASGTGISGVQATGWTVSVAAGTATVAASLAARTVAADGDSIGFNQVLTISAASSGSQVALTSSSLHAQVSAGDILDVLAHVQATNQAGVTGLRMFVSTQSGITLNKFFYDFAHITATAKEISDNLNGIMAVENVDFRSTANGAGSPTSFTVRFDVYFGTANGTCTLKVGRVTCHKK